MGDVADSHTCIKAADVDDGGPVDSSTEPRSSLASDRVQSGYPKILRDNAIVANSSVSDASFAAQ